MLFDLPKLPRPWRWGTGLLLAALVLLGTKFSPCSLAALGILALFTLTGNLSDIAFFFVLITPLATVFRPNASAQSYLTYVLLLYALVSILNTLFIRREVDVISMLLLVFFLAAVAGQLLAPPLDWKRTLKLAANLLLVKDAIRISDEGDCRDIFLSYLFGLIIASAAALTSPGFLAIADYVTAKTLSAGYGLGTLRRFSALYADPNYYGVNIIIGLCLLVVLYRKKQIDLLPLSLLAAALFFFGILTYSKSVTLMLVVPAALLMVCAAQRRQYLLLSLLSIGFALFLAAIITGTVSAFDVVLMRFQAGDSSLNSLTSGRTGIWMEYLHYCFHDVRRALFGSGLGAGYLPTGKGLAAAHNFYIEVLYHLGLLGFGYFFTLLWAMGHSIQKHIRRNILNGSIFLCIGILYLALNQLFNFELPVHLIVAFLVWNSELPHQRQGRQLN